jgi:K+/H+ antiporter YhaU regulatory subunit KhtT
MTTPKPRTKKLSDTDSIKKPREKKLPVSPGNIAKAAARLLSQRLVSTEVDYIQRTLGASSTQQQIDATVVAVRKLPWTSIVVPD